MAEHSMDVDSLLAELTLRQKGAKPIALLSRHLDMPKKKVLKLIDKAREELNADGEGWLIMNNGNGSYYLMRQKEKTPNEETSLLSVFES